MKILIASDTFYPNVDGTSYFTQRLAAMLSRRGHEVFVFAPSKSFKDDIFIRDGVTVFGIRSIPILIYPGFRFSPFFLVRKAIKNYIREINPDIIHIQNHFFIGKGAVVAARELDIPIMGTNHFMPENLIHYAHLPRFVNNWLKLLVWRQFYSIFKKLDAVATPTKTAASFINNSNLKKEVIPVSCGIDLNRFNPNEDSGNLLKEYYDIPENCPIILYVGRLEKEKRVDLIIRALPQIIEKTNAHLVIAGVGTLRPSLEVLAKKLGVEDSLTFTGFVPDKELPNLYRIANLFVIASSVELQSIATMEAMASGLPVIASNAMALPELVRDGENGYLFNGNDDSAIAQRAIKILCDFNLRTRMSQKSLGIIQAHDINKTMDRYESLYIQTITSRVYAPKIIPQAVKKSSLWSILMPLTIMSLAFVIYFSFADAALAHKITSRVGNKFDSIEDRIAGNFLGQ